MDTKACNLTQDEIKELIRYHGAKLYDEVSDDTIERINYLNKRLKAFNEANQADQPKAAPETNSGFSAQATQGWNGNNG